MGTMAVVTDISGVVKPVVCGVGTATAGGTGDATAVTGATIDRANFQSLIGSVYWQAALTASKNLNLQIEYQTSSDGSSWNTAVVMQASSQVQAGGSGGTFLGQTNFRLNLAGFPRYLRINFTPDLTHTSTDTFAGAAAVTLGGELADTPNNTTWIN